MQHKDEVIDYKIHYKIRTITPRQRGTRSKKINKIAVREKEDDDALIFEAPRPQIIAQSSRTSSATFSGVTSPGYIRLPGLGKVLVRSRENFREKWRKK